VRTALVAIPGTPFGVVTTRDGRWSFVAAINRIAVLSDGGFAPKLVR
jgi:hypothetical protein